MESPGRPQKNQGGETKKMTNAVSSAVFSPRGFSLGLSGEGQSCLTWPDEKIDQVSHLLLGMVALATRPRGHRDGKVERRVVAGRADYVLASMSAGLSCVTRRRVAGSGDGGCCDGVACGVSIFFFAFAVFLSSVHCNSRHVRSVTPCFLFMLINDESRARILLKREMWALNRSDGELAIPASNDALFLNQMHFVLFFFSSYRPLKSLQMLQMEKKVDPPPPVSKKDCK